MITLAIDTAGSACSVAIGRGSTVIAAHRREMRHGHAETLMPMVDAAMGEAGLSPSELDAVAVSLGPGGFTGIRVGLAAAHGIALASGARLIGITSFAAVAAAARPTDTLLVALDSRRADLYVQLFDRTEKAFGEPLALLPDRLAEWVPSGPLSIAGDAAAAAAAALAGRSDIAVLSDTAPDACGVLAAALAQDNDSSRARPLYLRPPDVTFPSVPQPRPPRRPPARGIGPLPRIAAEPLAILHRACFPDDPWDADAFARILGLSGCFGHLAWEGNAPIGFILARDLGDECEVLSIGVVPGARGRGTGARLMQTVLAETRRRGAASVVLEVAADNQAARRLYSKLGFVQVGRRPHYYRRTDGLADALILRLGLANALTAS